MQPMNVLVIDGQGGGPGKQTGLAHGVCRQTVGAHRSEPGLRTLCAQGCHQLFAKATVPRVPPPVRMQWR